MWQNLLFFLLDIQSKQIKRGVWHILGHWHYSIWYYHVHNTVIYTSVQTHRKRMISVQCVTQCWWCAMCSSTRLVTLLGTAEKGGRGAASMWEPLYCMPSFAVNLNTVVQRLTLCRKWLCTEAVKQQSEH